MAASATASSGAADDFRRARAVMNKSLKHQDRKLGIAKICSRYHNGGIMQPARVLNAIYTMMLEIAASFFDRGHGGDLTQWLCDDWGILNTWAFTPTIVDRVPQSTIHLPRPSVGPKSCLLLVVMNEGASHEVHDVLSATVFIPAGLPVDTLEAAAYNTAFGKLLRAKVLPAVDETGETDRVDDLTFVAADALEVVPVSPSADEVAGDDEGKPGASES